MKMIFFIMQVISIFTLVGIIFVPIGVVALLASHDVMLLKFLGYENACVPSNMTDNKIGYIQNPNISKACTRVLKVKFKYF
ncbi:ALA-interacting subunit 1 [Platanthera zijinensis]|uniref:ALA-interacting subunit 1 n=1 Tax=Platanthera zijinensis TaxID=2320716 RepID=A0AAP0BCB5_9ASPA